MRVCKPISDARLRQDQLRACRVGFELLPELAERSVEDLMEDRGVTPIPGGGSK